MNSKDTKENENRWNKELEEAFQEQFKQSKKQQHDQVLRHLNKNITCCNGMLAV
jgi:hypothetical protein